MTYLIWTAQGCKVMEVATKDARRGGPRRAMVLEMQDLLFRMNLILQVLRAVL